jgi:hypothetical protein
MDLASTASADAGTTTNAGTSGNAGTGTSGNAGVPNAADPVFAGGDEPARVPSSAYLAAHTEREPGTVSVTEVVASGECASVSAALEGATGRTCLSFEVSLVVSHQGLADYSSSSKPIEVGPASASASSDTNAPPTANLPGGGCSMK